MQQEKRQRDLLGIQSVVFIRSLFLLSRQITYI